MSRVYKKEKKLRKFQDASKKHMHTTLLLLMIIPPKTYLQKRMTSPRPDENSWHCCFAASPFCGSSVMIAFLHTHIDCCSFIVSCQIDLAFVEEEYELELIDPILNERPIVCLWFVCHNDCPPYHIIPHQIEHGRKCIRPSLFRKSQEWILRECQLVVQFDTVIFQS